MRRSRNQSSPPELNLAPIMNMVVILIPLLLLSVVFLSVGVINVSSSAGIVTGKPTDPVEPPLDLTIAIAPEGFIVSTRDGVKPAITGCPSGGPTVCLSRSVDVNKRFGDARTAFEADDTETGNAALDEASEAYDWKGLYETLAQIKKEHSDETTVNITAEPNIPYVMVVRTMDVARFELEKSTYASNRDMWSSGKKRPLFPDPILALAR